MITSWELLTLDDELLLTRAVVAILDASGEHLLGTGSFIDTNGAILTAHHVVANRQEVRVRRSNGDAVNVAVQTENLLEDHDLAILDTSWTDCDALPIAKLTSYIPVEFKSRGFQFSTRGLRDGLPLWGKIGGRTRVEYGSYKLSSVLSLSDIDIDRGSSGAPLFDPACKAIVGIVVSTIPATGRNNSTAPRLAFASPLYGSVTIWPPLSAILERSNGAIARFGPLMNLAGAQTVCDAQRKATTDFLSKAGLFKRGRIVDRAPFSAAFLEFQQGGKAVLPLVGFSGVGKTSAIAKLADEDLPTRPLCVFLRGVDIASQQDGLKGLVESALAKLSEELRFGVPVLVGDIVRVARKEQSKLLILLDALNETAVSPRELANGWIPKTVDWLGLSTKLVVTCRPEFWQLQEDAWPAELLHSTPVPVSSPTQVANTSRGNDKPVEILRESRLIALGDFSPQEAREALEAYGLADVFSEEEVLHPFLLAIAAELGREISPTGSNIYSIIEAFVRGKIERALRRIEQPTWREPVLNRLVQVAKLMLSRQTQAVDDETLSGLFSRFSDAIEPLAEEHLWLLERGVYRFQFDQVREFLQAASVDVLPLLRALEFPIQPNLPDKSLARSWTIFRYFSFLLLSVLRGIPQYLQGLHQTPPSTVAFAIMYMAVSGRLAQFQQALDLLTHLTRAYPSPRPFAVYAQQVSIQLILRIKSLNLGDVDYISWVRTIAANEARISYAPDNGVLADTLIGAVGSAGIPLTDKLDILRSLLVTESDIHWSIDGLESDARQTLHLRYAEPADEAREAQPDFALSVRHNRPIARQLENLASRQPREVIETLIGWLDDETSLGIRTNKSGIDVHIGDCAAICIFFLSSKHQSWAFRRLLSDDGLFKKTLPRVDTLTRALAVLETEELLATSMTILVERQSDPPEHVARVAWQCTKNIHIHGRLTAVQLFAFLLDRDLKPEVIRWIARALFEERAFAIRMIKKFGNEWSKEFMKALESSLPKATAIILEILSRCDLTAIKDDYEYAFAHDFEKTATLVRDCCTAGGPTLPLVQGFMSQLAAQDVREHPDRISTYKELARTLSSTIAGSVDAAKIAFAESLASDLVHAGNPAYGVFFTIEEAVDLGLVELGKQLIRDGGERVRREFVHLAIATRGQVRDEILAVMKEKCVDDETYGEFVRQLCMNVSIYAGSFEWVLPDVAFQELMSFRPLRPRLWDHAVLSYIGVVGSAELREKIATYWRALEPEARTDVLQDFFSHLNEDPQAGVQQAAFRAVSLSDFGKRHYQQLYARRRRGRWMKANLLPWRSSEL